MDFIDIREFEHYFKSNALKKGLTLFKENKIVFQKGESGFLKFITDSTQIFEISLLKKGYKISHFDCSCKKQNYLCEHICGVLFYLTQNTLDFQSFKSLLKNTKIRNVRRNNLLNNYRLYVKNIVKHVLSFDRISKKNINLILLKLKEKELLVANRYELLLFHLAVICELPGLFSKGKFFNSALVYRQIDKSVIYLSKHLSTKISETEKSAVYLTLMQIIKNKRYVNIDYFDFIFKKALVVISNKSEIDFISAAIFKLHNKPLNYLFSVDKLKVLKEYVALKKNLINGISLETHIENSNMEHNLAMFEILIYTGNKKEGIKKLMRYYHLLKNEQNIKLLPFLHYVIRLCSHYKNKKLEIKCICDLIIYDYEFSDELIIRLKALVTIKHINGFIDKIINEIKLINKLNSISKIVKLLNHFKRFDDIVSELKNVGNQFSLLNSIAIKNLPLYSIEFIDLYIVHLKHALQNPYEFKRDEIFKSAKKYIDKLPENARGYILEKLPETYNHKNTKLLTNN